MNLQALARAVRSNFTSLQESQVIGRIMVISGRNFSRSLKGYEMLVAEKLLPENFIDPGTKGILYEMFRKNPALKDLFDRFDLVPGKMIRGKKPEFVRPPKLTDEEILQRLSFSNLEF